MGKTWNTNIILIYSEEVHSDSPKRNRVIKWWRSGSDQTGSKLCPIPGLSTGDVGLTGSVTQYWK